MAIVDKIAQNDLKRFEVSIIEKATAIKEIPITSQKHDAEMARRPRSVLRILSSARRQAMLGKAVKHCDVAMSGSEFARLSSMGT